MAQDTNNNFITYIKNNIFLFSWNILILLGGLVFLFYFLHIGYFPELAFDDALLLFPAVIIVALFFTFVLSVFLICPCFMWYAGISETNYIKELPDDKKRKISFGFFFVPSIIFVLLLHFLNSFRLAILVSTFISAVYFAILYYCYWVKKIGKERKKPFFSLLFSWVMGAFLFLLGMLFFYLILDKGDLARYGSMRWYIISGLLLSLLVASNFIVLFPPEKINKILWRISVPLATLFFIIASVGDLSLIPKMTVSKLKLGNIENAKLLLNQEGCKILKFYDLPVSENKKDNVCSNKDKINILLRIGENFYIDGISEGNRSVRFTLPKKDIISWSPPIAKR